MTKLKFLACVRRKSIGCTSPKADFHIGLPISRRMAQSSFNSLLNLLRILSRGNQRLECLQDLVQFNTDVYSQRLNTVVLFAHEFVSVSFLK